MRVRLLFPIYLALLLAVGRGAEPGEALARFSSQALREYDARMEALRAELAGLPPAPEDQSSERVGWHSEYGFGKKAANTARSVQLDLGAVQPVDAVVLVPVNVAYGARPGPGYGFPLRFRVELSDDPTFSAPILLADHTGEDFPNPGNLPVFVEGGGGRGRYVRVTATRLFTRENDALFALGELLVLQGARNLAFGARVEVSDTYDNAPTWEAKNLTDGQSVLGPPVRPARPPGNGYHAEIARSADEPKWLELDLGRSYPLDEISIFAPSPVDFPARRGFGFPARFRLEVSQTPGFQRTIVLADFTQQDCVNPGANAFLVPAGGVVARYVRLTTKQLWQRNNDFVFAVSEFQVMSGGEAVSRHAEPSASDSLEIGLWQLRHVNDGFASQGELIAWPGWLRGLSRRRELTQALERLAAEREPLVARALRRAGGWSLAVLGGVVAGSIAWLRRQRHARRQEVSRLRQRIAGDLHDEIGSNLGSIALLARLAGAHGAEAAREDLAEIQRIAQESAESMRDIVWLIQPGRREAADLVARMREIAATSLADLEWRFEAIEVTGPFTLEFQRQVFLLYKEALHNIRKHARARHVAIQAVQENHELVLTIGDDGIGFDDGTASGGHGLTSMRHRAALLRGTLAFQSNPRSGTRIELRAPLS
jgi:signal transduction histidine kinase